MADSAKKPSAKPVKKKPPSPKPAKAEPAKIAKNTMAGASGKTGKNAPVKSSKKSQSKQKSMEKTTAGPAEKPRKISGGHTLGKQLKALREARKIDLRKASKDTKIREAYISAIEDDKLESLPGNFYVKAYVKAYADYLGMDSFVALEEVKKQKIDIDSNAPTPQPYKDSHRPGAFSLLMTCLLIGLLVYGFTEYQKRVERQLTEEHQLSTQVPLEQQQTQEEKVLEVFTNLEPVMTIVAAQPVVITIKNDKDIVLTSRQLAEGETYFVPEDKNLTLYSDTMEKLEIYIDAQRVADLASLRNDKGGVDLDIYRMLSQVTVQ